MGLYNTIKVVKNIEKNILGCIMTGLHPSVVEKWGSVDEEWIK